MLRPDGEIAGRDPALKGPQPAGRPGERQQRSEEEAGSAQLFSLPITVVTPSLPWYPGWPPAATKGPLSFPSLPGMCLRLHTFASSRERMVGEKQPWTGAQTEAKPPSLPLKEVIVS